MAQIEIIKTIKNYLKKLNDSGIPVDTAYLYGSFARDEANELSDIDVLLVSDSFEKVTDELIGEAWGVAFPIDHRLAPYLVSKKRFVSDDSSIILDAVRKEGIEIKA